MQDCEKPTEKQPLDYAGFWVRLAAMLIDSLVIFTLALAALSLSINMLLLLPVTWNEASFAYVSTGVFIAVVIGLSYAFFPAFWVWRGQSPGQITFRLKVVRSDGSGLGWNRAHRRYLGYALSTVPLFIGFWWIFLDSRRQGFHDKIADTLVIRLPREYEKHDRK